MVRSASTPFGEILDSIELLSAEEQDALIEVVSRRRAERRRDEIARNACETLDAVRDGRAQYGTVEDLKRELSDAP